MVINYMKTLNPTQQLFMDILKAHKGENLTLAEISKLAGKEIKTGSINCLLMGDSPIVVHGKEKTVEVVVKKKVMTYCLPKEE